MGRSFNIKMLRHKPKFEYNGLTIVVSNPSRFDTDELLSGNGGYFLCKEILYQQGITRWSLDIRLAADESQLLPYTKVVLLLGERAMKRYLPKEYADKRLDEMRGSPIQHEGIIYIASYLPQDCVDRANHEARLNPELMSLVDHLIKEKEEKDALTSKRRKMMTLRGNYRFWLHKDVEKAIRLLENPSILTNQPKANYVIYPNSSVAVDYLQSYSDVPLFFDMETDELRRITVFSVGYSLDTIMSIPIVTHDYKPAYGMEQLCNIIKAFALAVHRNILVAHNGHGFDYFILAWKYKIMVKRVFDTMVAQHRCYPEVEKSLGHCISLWTYELFHKDEASFAYGNKEQAYNHWMYCAKDVSSMMRVYHGQMEYAKTVRGLEASFAQAMSSSRPYLTTSLQGIAYRDDKAAEMMSENDKLMMQYLRHMEYLIGPQAWKELKRMSKKALPSSNNQCVKYFHDMVGLPVVGRSKKTGKPSLNEVNLLKLKLKYNNPMIDLCIAYRKRQHESSNFLRITPWDRNICI